MAFFARFNLFAAFRDLADFMRARQKHEFIAALAALIVTGWVVYALAKDSYMPIQPRITYVENWPATRTDDQIKAEQKVDAAAKHKAAAERRAAFQKLADEFGIDTSPRAK